MRRIILKRPVTLTLSREQILFVLTSCPKHFTNDCMLKEAQQECLRIMKRWRQKLSLALVELDTAASKEATVVLTELESFDLRHHVDLLYNEHLQNNRRIYMGNVPKFDGLKEAIVLAQCKELALDSSYDLKEFVCYGSWDPYERIKEYERRYSGFRKC